MMARLSRWLAKYPTENLIEMTHKNIQSKNNSQQSPEMNKSIISRLRTVRNS